MTDYKKRTNKKKTTNRKKKAVTKSTKLSLDELIDMKPVQVHDFTFEQIKEASDIYSASRTMWLIADLKRLITTGYTLNKYEITAMDEFIKEYETQYKSPLAKALREE